MQTHIIKPGLAGNVAESQQEDVRSGVPAGERSDPVGSPAQPAPIRRRESQQHRAMDGPGNTAAARKTRTRRRGPDSPPPRGAARNRAEPPPPRPARPAVAPQRAAPAEPAPVAFDLQRGGSGEIYPECERLSGRGKSLGGGRVILPPSFCRSAASGELEGKIYLLCLSQRVKFSRSWSHPRLSAGKVSSRKILSVFNLLSHRSLGAKSQMKLLKINTG